MAGEYKRRIAVATLIGELTSSTLRVATVRAAQADAMLPCSEARYETVREAYSRILADLPEHSSVGRTHTVVFGCAKGLCGGLDSKLSAGATALPGASLSVFGRRTAESLGVEALGDDVPDYRLCKALADGLASSVEAGETDVIRVMRAEGEGILSTDIYPVEASERGYLVTDLPPAELASALLRQYLADALFFEAVGGYSAQQRARLRSMDRASENAEKLRDELISAERRERQAQITNEIVDNQGNL